MRKILLAILILLLPAFVLGAEFTGVTLTGVSTSTAAFPAWSWPMESTLVPTAGDDSFIGTVTHAGTNRTYIDSDTGLITSIGANLPRFENVNGYDAVLIEPAGTNLVTHSHEFDNASWVKLRVSISADAVVGPDGTTSADKLVEDGTASSTHLARFTIANSSLTNEASVTFSAYLKPAERTWVNLQIKSKSITYYSAYFNLSTGEAGAENVDDYGSDSMGDGWYRCWVTVSIDTGAADPTFQINLADDNLGITYDGDGTSGIYIWGAQVEESPVPTSYVATSGATATRQTESGFPQFALPSIFSSSGTLITWVRPSFAYDDVSAGDYGITACDDAAKSLLYFDENGMICSYDGTTEATSGAINWSSGDWIKAVVKWGNSSFRVGHDSGTGLTWGPAQPFDGAYTTTGGNLRTGYGLFSRQHTRQLAIFDTILTDAEINERTGNP